MCQVLLLVVQVYFFHLTVTLWRRYYHLHVTEEETESQSQDWAQAVFGQQVCPSHSVFPDAEFYFPKSFMTKGRPKFSRGSN